MVLQGMHSPISAPAGNADNRSQQFAHCSAMLCLEWQGFWSTLVYAAQPSKDCVQKTLKRLEEKIAGKVLNQILYSMNCSDAVMQHRTATALARLAREADLKTVFVERKGLDILLQILTDPKRDALCHKEAAGVLTWPPACMPQPHKSVICSFTLSRCATCGKLCLQRSKHSTLGPIALLVSRDIVTACPNAGALFELAKKANATAPIDCAPAPPTPQVRVFEGSGLPCHWHLAHLILFSMQAPQCSAVCRAGTSCRLYRLEGTEGETACSKAVMMLTFALDLQVYLGEQYVNNLTLSDVTFLVEGQTFHAHRIALLASSDTFRAMFDGHYKEKEASTIPIPNIRYCVFESMMRCIYTGEILYARAAVASAALFYSQLCTGRPWKCKQAAIHVCTSGVILCKGALQAHHVAALASSHAACGLCHDRGAASCNMLGPHVAGQSAELCGLSHGACLINCMWVCRQCGRGA